MCVDHVEAAAARGTTQSPRGPQIGRGARGKLANLDLDARLAAQGLDLVAHEGPVLRSGAGGPHVRDYQDAHGSAQRI